jgi:hypothetical protein
VRLSPTRTRTIGDGVTLRCAHCDSDRINLFKPESRISRKTRMGAASQRRGWTCYSRQALSAGFAECVTVPLTRHFVCASSVLCHPVPPNDGDYVTTL